MRKPNKQKRRRNRRLILASPRCAYCRRDLKAGAHDATMDHLVPRSRGGRDTRDNIVPACGHCNRSKRDRTPEEWAQDVLDAAKAASNAPATDVLTTDVPATEGGAV